MLNRKQYRRIEAENLVAQAELDGVRGLPSFRTVTCSYCGHSGRARIPHGLKQPRFKCSKCGRRN